MDCVGLRSSFNFYTIPAMDMLRSSIHYQHNRYLKGRNKRATRDIVDSANIKYILLYLTVTNTFNISSREYNDSRLSAMGDSIDV